MQNNLRDEHMDELFQAILNLEDLRRPNLRAAIVGKALYDGRASFRELSRLPGRPSHRQP